MISVQTPLMSSSSSLVDPMQQQAQSSSSSSNNNNSIPSATAMEEKRPTTPETWAGTVSSSSFEDAATAAQQEDHDTTRMNNNDETAATLTPQVLFPSVTASSDHTNLHNKDDAKEEVFTSPASVCQQRKLSAAIVSSSDAAVVGHNVVAGRPTVTLEALSLQHNNHNANASSTSFHESLCEFPATPPVVAATPHNSRDTTHQSRHHRGVSTGVSKRRSSHAQATKLPPQRQHSAPSDLDDQHLKSKHSIPEEEDLSGSVLTDPPPMRIDAWAEPPATSYQVRGPTYLKDKKKMVSEESIFSLLTVDLVRTSGAEPIFEGLCGHPQERIQRALRREQATGVRELPDFVFAINLCVPGTPVYHCVAYFGCNNVEELRTDQTPLGRIANRFFFGTGQKDEDDIYRDNTFKLVPRIVDGNFVVKSAVGSKPTILGRKLKQHYVVGPSSASNNGDDLLQLPRYLELVCDIGSDPIAKKVVALSIGYAKTLIVDMMFVLEGTTNETLPERIFAGVRLKNLDFKKRDGQRVVPHPKR